MLWGHMHPVARHQVTPPALVPAEGQAAFSRSKSYGPFLVPGIQAGSRGAPAGLVVALAVPAGDVG